MTDTTKTTPPVETVLAEIRERHEAATSGEWRVADDHLAVGGAFGYCVPLGVFGAFEADPAFIANAHEDVPRLLKAVEDVLALANKAEYGATRWQDPLPVPEWVGRIREAITEALGSGR